MSFNQKKSEHCISLFQLFCVVTHFESNEGPNHGMLQSTKLGFLILTWQEFEHFIAYY